MLAHIAESYRRSRKPHDLLWNRFVARPLAAVVVVPLERTRVTPNQVTLATLFVFAGAMAILILVPGWRALLAAVVVLELAYVLDCVDGQLARVRGSSSPVGAHLDFLMDELKAFLLVAAVGVRLWRADDDAVAGGGARFLLEALVALVAVASAISLTTFVRRPEYAAATGAPAARGSGDYGEGFAAPPDAGGGWRRLLSPARAIEALGRFIGHYPSYIVFVALANRMDLFLHAYLVVNAAHAARSLLVIARKLGRSAPR